MKPKNFPARKLIRQQQADYRAGEPVPGWAEQGAAVHAARAVRTKKNRAGSR